METNNTNGNKKELVSQIIWLLMMRYNKFIQIIFNFN